MDDSVRDLAATLAAGDAPVAVRKGVVTAGSPLAVSIGASGISEPAACLAGYHPVVGDVVLVLMDGPGRIVLDKVVSPASASSWSTPTFAGAWVDHGGGFAAAAYRRLGDLVALRGVVKSGTIGTTVFTLPAGFRPPAHLIFAADSFGGAGRLDVQSDGQVVAAIGNNTYFSLGSVSFSIS